MVGGACKQQLIGRYRQPCWWRQNNQKSAAKSGNHAVGLTVETKRAGSPSLIQLKIDQQTNIAPGNNGWSNYNVLVKSDGVGISKPAGTYTDKYKHSSVILIHLNAI